MIDLSLQCTIGAPRRRTSDSKEVVTAGQAAERARTRRITGVHFSLMLGAYAPKGTVDFHVSLVYD